MKKPKIGDEVWHTAFTLDGQVDGPGIVKEFYDGDILIEWADNLRELYSPHELSDTDPRQSEA